MADLRLSTGTYFIVSFGESRPKDSTLHFIFDNRIGGIILFAQHCQDPDSLRHWLTDFKKSTGPEFIVAVDQEGGRVRRFKNNFPDLESPRFYGYHKRYDEYRSDLSRTCDRLRETGINFNLVPTVDLFDTATGHVLDMRTFSDDIETVNAFAALTIEVHHRHGLLTGAKHFPGLGRSHGDPHDVLAAADLVESDFINRELIPFRKAAQNGVDSIMVTHLSVPEVDPDPTIISSKIITGWLKHDLDFTGPVITDDLLMQGAARSAAFPEVAAATFKAGSDLLLFGADLKKVRQAFDYFSAKADSGEFEDNRLRDAAERIDLLRQKLTHWYG